MVFCVYNTFIRYPAKAAHLESIVWYLKSRQLLPFGCGRVLYCSFLKDISFVRGAVDEGSWVLVGYNRNSTVFWMNVAKYARCASATVFHSSVNMVLHIFPKAQVAANKNAHNFWHYFPAQVFMLFHMAWSILFGVLKLKFLLSFRRFSPYFSPNPLFSPYFFKLVFLPF